jgi:hypothetical protein
MVMKQIPMIQSPLLQSCASPIVFCSYYDWLPANILFYYYEAMFSTVHLIET